MKFTPRELHGNVNVSATHPLIELAWMVGGLLLIALTFLLVLSLGTDYAASHLNPQQERWLGEHLPAPFPAESSPALQNRLDELLQKLPADSPLRNYPFSVQVVETPEVNAVALPGWKIVVFRGLLNKVGSENELGMILAHELGHFANRDHLRGLGRGLGITVLSLVLFGQDSSVSDAAVKFLLGASSHYSRQQETDADRFGLELLVTRYGHAGGATDFFRRFDAEAGSRIPYLLASHPHPGDRIKAIEELIASAGYPLQEVAPLSQEFVQQETPESKEQN